MLTLITIPSASTFFAAVADYSGTMFTELLPVIYLIAGLIVGALFAKMLLRGGLNAVKSFGGGKRGGRRRR